MTYVTRGSSQRVSAGLSSRPLRRTVLVRASGASGAFPHNGQGGISRPDLNRNVCGVFQLNGSPVGLSLNDVRDAYEACSTARSPSERRQCFEVYGLDADKIATTSACARWSGLSTKATRSVRTW
ncbi:hypothetical protein PLESTM_001196800 [Pleodorina starrii]|nr:hypothetical protein PLESTM_001196800 [Pleodorina starrii]